MFFNNISRHLAAGMMVGCLTLTLFTGCTEKANTNNSAGNGESAQSANATENKGDVVGDIVTEKIPIPERDEVSTAPAFTFKFGDIEAKGYELKGVDLAGKDGKSNKIRSSVVAFMHGELYFYLDSKPVMSLAKVKMDEETIADLTTVSDGYAINELTTNGDVVIFKDHDKVLNVYDGNELKKGEKCHKFNPLAVHGSKDIYYMQGNKIKASTLDGANLTNDRDIVDLEKYKNDTGLSFGLFAIEGDVFFLRSEIKNDKGRTPILIAINKDGKELCRYEGLEELPRDWAITTNYVIHCGSKGNFRIYDKSNGKLIGDAHVEDIRPFVLSTLQGNDVLVLDDRSDKFYRIDF